MRIFIFILHTVAFAALMIFFLVVYSEAHAGNWFVSASYSLHDEATDCPEVCFGSNHLLSEKFGYTWEPTKAIMIDVYAMHMSSPFVVESGLGYNPYFNAEIRVKF